MRKFHFERKDLVFCLHRGQLCNPSEPKVMARTEILPLHRLGKEVIKELIDFQGRLSFYYLRFVFGSRETYLALVWVDKQLVHVAWVSPAEKARKRFPFVPRQTCMIGPCRTLPSFRGKGIYPFVLQQISRSLAGCDEHWIFTSEKNIASIRGIEKTGARYVGSCLQKRWLWGLWRKVKYCPSRETTDTVPAQARDSGLSQNGATAKSDSPFSESSWESRFYGKFLIYSGEYLKSDLDRSEVARFVRRNGALGAVWSYDHECGVEGPWFKYICDTVDHDVDNIKSGNVRSKVRRGLKRCSVRQVDYRWLADHAYEVYVNAAARYSNFVPMSRKEFGEQMRGGADVPGREAIGVFVDDKLAAYATLSICGESVRTNSLKFDPAHSRAYPMYALLHTIMCHYLTDEGYKKIDNGHLPLLHKTNIGDLLLSLGWRRDYCRLGIYLTWPVRLVLGLVRLLRAPCRLLVQNRHMVMLEGLLLAQDIARATSKR